MDEITEKLKNIKLDNIKKNKQLLYKKCKRIYNKKKLFIFKNIKNNKKK